jgi:hypothetical protein
METRKVKLGIVIQNFDNPPLQIKELLFPEALAKSNFTVTEKKRYKKVYDELFYKGSGKSYYVGSTEQIKYYKNKPGFYVLELPTTCARNLSKNVCVKDNLGYKIGKAESNPTSSKSVLMSVNSGGLYGRLMTYYIQLGQNVRILHLRVFYSEDLNYYGNKKRANQFEKAVKQQLKNAEHSRGGKTSEYYENIDDVKEAIEYVDKNRIYVKETPTPIQSSMNLRTDRKRSVRLNDL